MPSRLLTALTHTRLFLWTVTGKRKKLSFPARNGFYIPKMSKFSPLFTVAGSGFDLGWGVGGVDFVKGGGGRKSLKVLTFEVKVTFSMLFSKAIWLLKGQGSLRPKTALCQKFTKFSGYVRCWVLKPKHNIFVFSF